MINPIKDMIREKNEKKTKAISITLSKKILKDLDEEMQRLEIKNRSFMIEMVLVNYFNMPVPKKEEDVGKYNK